MNIFGITPPYISGCAGVAVWQTADGVQVAWRPGDQRCSPSLFGSSAESRTMQGRGAHRNEGWNRTRSYTGRAYSGTVSWAPKLRVQLKLRPGTITLDSNTDAATLQLPTVEQSWQLKIPLVMPELAWCGALAPRACEPRSSCLNKSRWSGNMFVSIPPSPSLPPLSHSSSGRRTLSAVGTAVVAANKRLRCTSAPASATKWRKLQNCLCHRVRTIVKFVVFARQQGQQRGDWSISLRHCSCCSCSRSGSGTVMA